MDISLFLSIGNLFAATAFLIIQSAFIVEALSFLWVTIFYTIHRRKGENIFYRWIGAAVFCAFAYLQAFAFIDITDTFKNFMDCYNYVVGF